MIKPSWHYRVHYRINQWLMIHEWITESQIDNPYIFDFFFNLKKKMHRTCSSWSSSVWISTSLVSTLSLISQSSLAKAVSNAFLCPTDFRFNFNFSTCSSISSSVFVMFSGSFSVSEVAPKCGKKLYNFKQKSENMEFCI